MHTKVPQLGNTIANCVPLTYTQFHDVRLGNTIAISVLQRVAEHHAIVFKLHLCDANKPRAGPY